MDVTWLAKTCSTITKSDNAIDVSFSRQHLVIVAFTSQNVWSILGMRAVLLKSLAPVIVDYEDPAHFFFVFPGNIQVPFCLKDILLVSCSISCQCQLQPGYVLGKYYVNNCICFLNLQCMEHAHLVLQYNVYIYLLMVLLPDYLCGSAYCCGFTFAGAKA